MVKIRNIYSILYNKSTEKFTFFLAGSPADEKFVGLGCYGPIGHEKGRTNVYNAGRFYHSLQENPGNNADVLYKSDSDYAHLEKRRCRYE